VVSQENNLKPVNDEKIKIIKGLGDLVDYLRSIGLSVTRQTLIKYINAGLPYWKFNNIYHFYVDNIDDFFRSACSSSKEDQEDREHLSSK